MKVGELIELLSTFDRDLTVEVYDNMEGVMAGTPTKAEINTQGDTLVIHTKWTQDW